MIASREKVFLTENGKYINIYIYISQHCILYFEDGEEYKTNSHRLLCLQS